MKKLLIVPILLLSILCNAQFTKGGGTFLKTGSGFMTAPTVVVDFYDEYDPIYAAFTTKPSSTIAAYQEALVYSLDTLDFAGGASVWDRMDVFYVFANNIEANALINWVNPGTFDADNVSSTSFTAYEGFTEMVLKIISLLIITHLLITQTIL